MVEEWLGVVGRWYGGGWEVVGRWYGGGWGWLGGGWEVVGRWLGGGWGWLGGGCGWLGVVEVLLEEVGQGEWNT